MKNKNQEFLVFKKKDIEEIQGETIDAVERSLSMLKTCLEKESGFDHPKYSFLIELLCESYSVNNKLKHFLEKSLEYCSTELKNGVESVYIDSQSALIIETLVMSKIMNASDLKTETNLSMSIH